MRRLLSFAAALALLPVGCQRLSFEKTYSLGSTHYWTAAFDAPRGEQKVTVTASSTKEPVNVFLILEEDLTEGEQAALNRVIPKKALGGQESAKEISFEVTVPAKKSFVVFIGEAKGFARGTDVKLSVKGR